ncbi:hypothetical protein GOV10_01465 [Candidatus Woesearchaeota archaeon]|nr:hypothetical protein [Candidatus Woesearchaeota archaeon]
MGEDLEKKFDEAKEKLDSIKEKREEIKHILGDEPAIRRFVDKVMRVPLYAQILCDPRHWKDLLNKDVRRQVFNSKRRQGLLTGSLLQYELYVPNGEGLEKEDAPPGRFVGYDFLRPKVLGKDYEQLKKGRLMTIPNSLIINNDRNDFTPTGAFDFFDFSHLLCVEFPSIEETLELGMLFETTIGQAYKMHNLYEQYNRQIEFFGLNDKTAYMVSPKGNGLVYLIRDFGSTKPEKEGVRELKPALSPLGLPF